MSNITIHSEQVTVKKRKNIIVDGLTFDVKAGHITGLIGPSGSGKTTLMRAIVGVQQLTQGSLTVLDMTAGSVELRRKIGYVTQDAAIYGDLTVLQNVQYFGELVRASKDDVDTVLGQVDLAAQSRQLATTLSGGQKARVSLAIALLGNPELLILDEPTVGLDPVLRRDLWQLFRQFAQQGKTLLVSSHVMDEAEQCDEILLMRGGKLLWHDSKEGLLAAGHASSVEQAFLNLVEQTT